MSVVDEFRKANDAYAANFQKGHLPMPPARHVAVLTCMDARLHPARFLGLDVADAHVIRNAGGLASEDAIRSLVISEQLLGTNTVVVIHHTDCGMKRFSNDALRARLRDERGVDASTIDFLPFVDLEESVREDVAAIRASALIPVEVPVSGRLKTDNGLLRRSAARAGAGILLAAEFLVADDLASGGLVPLLPNHIPASASLDVVCPTHRVASPKIRALIAFLSAHLAVVPEPTGLPAQPG